MAPNSTVFRFWFLFGLPAFTTRFKGAVGSYIYCSIHQKTATSVYCGIKNRGILAELEEKHKNDIRPAHFKPYL
jgi:hypothetical protein